VHGGHHKHSVSSSKAAENEMTYLLFRPWRISKSTLVQITTLALVLSLFMERYCFIVTVYKTKYFGYVMILIVIFFNCLFNFMLTRIRKKKHAKRLHELFNIERTPQVGWCIIGLIG